MGSTEITMTFEQLYNTYYSDVYRFAVWLTRDRSQADDVASETFVRAWARRDRLRMRVAETGEGAERMSVRLPGFLQFRRCLCRHRSFTTCS